MHIYNKTDEDPCTVLYITVLEQQNMYTGKISDASAESMVIIAMASHTDVW